MRTKSIMLLVLALGCGLIAAIGVTQVISQDSDTSQQAIEMVNILVAKKRIPEGRKITPEYVKIEAWPKEKVPDGALIDIKDIEGMRARSEIYADDPICEKKLLGKGDLRTATDHIDLTMRAVPIKIERDSNTGLIRPGDHVDVLANLRKNIKEGILQSRTITLLQNVEIFAVDDDYRPDPSNKGGETIVAKTVTLSLTPKQAMRLDVAQQNGKLRIIMRSPNDESIVKDTGGISLGELLGNDEKKTVPVEKPTITIVAQPVVSASETWKIRILSGEGVDDVVLEERNGNEGQKIWQVMREDEGVSGTQTSPAVGLVTPLGAVDSSLEPPGLEPSEE